jgi:dTDP-4-dehydrorhamnose 3,5-epimerase
VFGYLLLGSARIENAVSPSRRAEGNRSYFGVDEIIDEMKETIPMIKVRPLGIAGVNLVTPRLHSDRRGTFHEWFHPEEFSDSFNHELTFGQLNCSVSRRGVIRGMHYGDASHGLAKYVSCVHGEILDVAVDLRVGSPTFGQWDAARLDSRTHEALYLPEGMGHGFAALSPEAVVVFICSRPYNPEHEYSINPLDPELGIDWQLPHGIRPVLSDKDTFAPGLAQAQRRGILPVWSGGAIEAREHVAS